MAIGLRRRRRAGDTRAMTFGKAIRDRFLLEAGTDFLNNGSFGAAPRVVYETAERWRRRSEAQPVRFCLREFPPALNESRQRLAKFLNADPAGLAFVENATTGVETVLFGLGFAPGDEIVASDHVYGAVRKALNRLERRGVKIVTPAVAYPATSEDAIFAAIINAVTTRTKLVVVDHIASATALIFPVARIIQALKGRVRVLVDGAHTPGQLPLDITALGADWYVGNCHKWLFATRGCGFLYAAPDGRDIRPIIASHGDDDGFAAFDWVGTRDLSSFLTVPAALDFAAEIGLDAARAYCHGLAIEAATMIRDAWRTELGATPDLFANMATIALPKTVPCDGTRTGARAVQDRIYAAGVEVPVMGFGGRGWVRISAQVFNAMDDYRRLAKLFAA